MNRISAVIFDLDGTLIDSSNGVIDAVNYSLRQMGLPEQSPERIRSFIGFPLPEMYAAFTDASPDELHEHFQVRAAESVVASTVALDGTDSTLKSLRAAGYRLAIATTKIRRHIDLIVTKMGWEGLFEAAVGGDEVARVKPDPEAFRRALDLLGTDRQSAIVVGDTINDVLAARAIDLPVVGVKSPYGGQGQLEAAGPDHLIDSISDLPDLLDRVNADRPRRN